MAEFHNLKVADIYKETEDTSVVTFDVPSNLQEQFKFRQGQHLTLNTTLHSFKRPHQRGTEGLNCSAGRVDVALAGNPDTHKKNLIALSKEQTKNFHKRETLNV